MSHSRKDDGPSREFPGVDYLNLDELLGEEEREVQLRIRRFVSNEVVPAIEEYAQREEFPGHLIPELADHDLLGPTFPPPYGAGYDNIVYGLMMQELERGDSSIRSFCSVQSSLVMYSIFAFGTDTQRNKWLPAMAAGEAVGCFALTEPMHGSDPAGMETRARREGDEYIISGHKRWATNGSEADVAVVWARDKEEVIRGFLVELDRDGVQVAPIEGKWSLRAAITSEVIFDSVRVPATNRLPEARGLGAPLSCLNQARFGIAWGVIGAAMACYDAAVTHARERFQFDRPIGSFQLIQERLAEMLTEITKAQLLVHRLTQLKDAGRLRPQQVSLAKRNNCRMALDVARSARQVLGADGVLGKYPVMRHLMNLESVITYEGTDEIHTLVLGRDITGFSAFGG